MTTNRTTMPTTITTAPKLSTRAMTIDEKAQAYGPETNFEVCGEAIFFTSPQSGDRHKIDAKGCNCRRGFTGGKCWHKTYLTNEFSGCGTRWSEAFHNALVWFRGDSEGVVRQIEQIYAEAGAINARQQEAETGTLTPVEAAFYDNLDEYARELAPTDDEESLFETVPDAEAEAVIVPADITLIFPPCAQCKAEPSTVACPYCETCGREFDEEWPKTEEESAIERFEAGQYGNFGSAGRRN
jgi:hypothetical protein